MNLTEFLTARLDEDEAAAREAHYEGQRWLTEEEGVYRWPDDEMVHSADRKADARHIARHDPARVLREIAAVRKIMEAHSLAEHYCPIPVLSSRHGQLWTPEEGPCWTLRLLAGAWSDHPDYGEAVRPA